MTVEEILSPELAFQALRFASVCVYLLDEDHIFLLVATVYKALHSQSKIFLAIIERSLKTYFLFQVKPVLYAKSF